MGLFMNEMLTMAINLHLFIITMTIVLALYIIYASKSLVDNTKYINRMKYLQPQYMMLVSSIVFTGIAVMAVEHFQFRPTLILMILAALYIYFTSIKKHMLRKQTNTDNMEDMKFLRSYIKSKYIKDITAIVVVAMVSIFS
jgi:Ca2+/Na+ antiporter